jgi:hypothetical protein
MAQVYYDTFECYFYYKYRPSCHVPFRDLFLVVFLSCGLQSVEILREILVTRLEGYFIMGMVKEYYILIVTIYDANQAGIYIHNVCIID